MGNHISLGAIIDYLCPDDEVQEIITVNIPEDHEDEIRQEIETTVQQNQNRLFQNYVSEQSNDSVQSTEETPMVTVTKIYRYQSINTGHEYRSVSLNEYHNRLTEINRRTPSPQGAGSTILKCLQKESEAVDLLVQGKESDAAKIFQGLGYDENTFFAIKEKTNSRSSSPEEKGMSIEPSNK